jgi:stage V sporulation protein AE
VDYLTAFLAGGAICALAQIIYDNTKLTPAHILVSFTVAGAVLGGFGVYQRFAEFAGAGAIIPVSGFGNSIVMGMLSELERLGWEGLFTGAFEITGLGVTTAIVFGGLMAVLFQPKD